VPIAPSYENIKLTLQPDTLHFQLGAKIYNEIKSFNYFMNDGLAYISFYDRRSESIVIYNFHSRQLCKQLQLKRILKDKQFYKVSVYTQNFDSIYVTNLDKLYLLDSAGRISRTVQCRDGIENIAFYDTYVPIVVKQNIIYMGLRPFVKESSLPAIRKWKVLCGFDLNKASTSLYYPLPSIYHKGLYGRRFLNYSYCLNEKGNFVFSFPADTSIYETNLTDLHLAYNARSKFQAAPIEPVSDEALKKDEGSKEYALRDAYGPIYYDHSTHRYLRIVKHKIAKADFDAQNYRRSYGIIILNQQFKIIGEFLLDYDILLDSIMITQVGEIYARVNKDDENALHFVRLRWNEDQPMTKK